MNIKPIYFLALAIVLFSGIVSAATTISTDITTGGQLSVTGTSTFMGNVGVGTTTPYAKLSVVGVSGIVADKFTAISATATSTIYGKLSFGEHANLYRFTDAGSRDYLNIRPEQPNREMRVGIMPNGTFVPATSDSLIAGIKIFGTDFTQDQSNNNDFGLYLTSDSIRFNSKQNGTGTALPFVWSAQDSNKLMTLTTAGRLGIGTTTPRGYLDIGGYATTTRFTIPELNDLAFLSSNKNAVSAIEIQNISTGTSADMRYTIFDNNSNYVAIALPGINNSLSLFGTPRNQYAYLFTSGVGRGLAIGNIGPTDIVFGTSNQENMRLKTGGNLGIGTTTPATNLQVTAVTANATSTVTIGKVGQNKGSCLEMFDATGAVKYIYIDGTSLVVSATSCK
ncbi:MAG: hypothetical protein WCV79_03675 [Candidatus Paceibacterota bacterium]|jgi:hypothetical protein